MNVFGFNVGGPFTLGHLYNPDKKKTFFFYNMEWRRLIQGNINNGQVVPLAATYGGDFTGNVPADVVLSSASPDSGKSVPFSGLHAPCLSQIVNNSTLVAAYAAAGQPLSTANASGSCSVDSKASLASQPTFVPFKSNKIPFLDANAAALLTAGIFPAPTNGNKFFGSANVPTSLKEEVVRIDHNFSSKFSVFGHYIAEQVSQGYAISQWSGANVPTVGDTFGNPSFSGVVHTTYAISPTLLNEVAFNYNGNRINIIPFAGAGMKSLSAKDAGFTGARLFTGPNNLSRIPNIDLNGGTTSR